MERTGTSIDMTQTVTQTVVKVLRRTAVRATRAPSVHNTQPWRLVLRPDVLEIYADWDRQLKVLDPRGRQLLLSCGCAIFNARAALAAADVAVVVERLADSSRPDLVARLIPTDSRSVDLDIARLDQEIDRRHTNRRQFDDAPVPDAVVNALVEVARAEGAQLFPIVREPHRLATARLSQLANRLEMADPAYRAELHRWTTDDPRRADGVPAFAVPYVGGLAEDDVPIRDFDTRGMGWLPSRTRSSMNQCLLLLGTNADNPSAWVQAGEALERVLLEVTRLDYTSSPLTQVIEVPHTAALLREELGLSMHPHVLLRIGHAPETPATRRRRLVDVLNEME